MEEAPVAEIPKEERQWAAFAHLAALLLLVAPPIGGILGPLVIWILKKDEMPFVRQEGRESLNFQITVLIAMAVAGILVLVLVGLVLLPLIALANIVLVVVATLQASDGKPYRYPFNLRLIR